ncbi:uncharacterized protein MELLADRAFT_110181 [Melampsora larici-populina 98AG31]|uniref:Uncharacterized protein n=1 Tax=Melampsora larici-populina (strain 98AG31 / pathotype 3-4-7) TaxID=747676 RepID=F4RYY2_MELLP|nr:uncharacterized protein MELLADRAFT_110181 [Melampsora larici-populina 98AG31]EGG02423.1 hypothetical protein MELLADRAFT_110181 [Melampsora larici-populina 98AG31]
MDIEQSTLNQSPVIIPTFSASIVGFVSGMVSAGKLSGAQFTCENLHRLPTSRQAAYLFQKTKNYRIILGGLKGGLRSGARLGAWTGAFCSMKEVTLIPIKSSIPHEDQLHCRFIAGGISGFILALGASSLYRLRPIYSPRRLMLGGLVGMLAGGAEDLKDILANRENHLINTEGKLEIPYKLILMKDIGHASHIVKSGAFTRTFRNIHATPRSIFRDCLSSIWVQSNQAYMGMRCSNKSEPQMLVQNEYFNHLAEKEIAQASKLPLNMYL